MGHLCQHLGELFCGQCANDAVEFVAVWAEEHQAVSLGCGDIGYHVLVDRFGRLWEGARVVWTGR